MKIACITISSESVVAGTLVSVDYVVNQSGCYRIMGTHVSLDSIVYAFLEGDFPETIAHCFPALKLEQVYQAIACYLAHRSEIDSHLRLKQADFERRRQIARRQISRLYEKLDKDKKFDKARRASEID